MRSGPLDLFLQPWRENIEFRLGHIILCVLFPNRAADISHSNAALIVYYRAPRTGLGNDDEILNAGKRCRLVFGRKWDITIPVIGIEAASRTSDKIEHEVETMACTSHDRM